MELGVYYAGMTAFLAHFGAAVSLTVLFLLGYTRLTPHREWKLIAEGVPAASVSLIGSLFGFVLPLASAIAHSVNLVDCALWGLVALLIQWLVFVLIRWGLRDLPDRIAKNDFAAAILVGGLSSCIGFLNAACMTW
jgi:putative membrane protein